MAKAKKKRAPKSDPKLAINGTFADVIRVSVKPEKKEEKPKTPAKKKK